MNTSLNRLPFFAVVLSGIALLAACTAPKSSTKEDMTGVVIHSLNYSAREVATIGVEPPDDPGGSSGWDSLDPYKGGGIICCLSVPSKWRPDFKVAIEYQFYPEKEYRKALVSVPPYPNGIVGDAWLIVHEDESVEAVVSNYLPSHDEWPGKVKGYPVPSREYQLKQWEQSVERARLNVAEDEKSLRDFSKESINRRWNFDLKHRKKEIQAFSGPDDPAYADFVRDGYKRELEFSSRHLESLLKNKP